MSAHAKQARQSTEAKACCVQPYRGRLFNNAECLCAVAAGNDHHFARAEDVDVDGVEVHAATPGVGDRLPDHFYEGSVAGGTASHVTRDHSTQGTKVTQQPHRRSPLGRRSRTLRGGGSRRLRLALLRDTHSSGNTVAEQTRGDARRTERGWKRTGAAPPLVRFDGCCFPATPSEARVSVQGADRRRRARKRAPGNVIAPHARALLPRRGQARTGASHRQHAHVSAGHHMVLGTRTRDLHCSDSSTRRFQRAVHAAQDKRARRAGRARSPKAGRLPDAHPQALSLSCLGAVVQGCVCVQMPD